MRRVAMGTLIPGHRVHRDGPIHPIRITTADVDDAILLCQIIGSNTTLRCTLPCDHADPQYCAAAAIDASRDTVTLMFRAACAVWDAWLRRENHRLVLHAHEPLAGLFSAKLEVECLLREGWLPREFVLR